LWLAFMASQNAQSDGKLIDTASRPEQTSRFLLVALQNIPAVDDAEICAFASRERHYCVI
jgi:hypothetical protein